jgi:DNA invertase Pin-like site-specific DNA recombinase
MANMLAPFAQFERRLISQRKREALAVKRASGVRLGRQSFRKPSSAGSSGSELAATPCALLPRA